MARRKLGEIAMGVVRSTEDDKEYNIIDYVESSWGLNRKLYPVQKIILKAHYGIALDTKKKNVPVRDWKGVELHRFTEAEYLKYLYDEGRSNISEVIPGKQRRFMCLSIGRRGGKSMISGCILSYETEKLVGKGDPHAYYGIPRSTLIEMIAIATDQKQAGILYNEVSGHFADCTNFHPYLSNFTQSYTKLQTPEDIRVSGRYGIDDTARSSIKITFKPCRASGLRGSTNIVIILDEVAHFSEEGEGGAKTVFQATKPSQATLSEAAAVDDEGNPIGENEGRFIMISSPMGKSGFFYKKFMQGFESGLAAEEMLCIQAPTWEVNPKVPASHLASEYSDDPVSFMVEYGARFESGDRDWLKDKRDLYACINSKLKLKQRQLKKTNHYIGIDIAAINHMCGLCIGHINSKGNIEVDVVAWIQAKHGKYEGIDRIPFDDIADWIAGYFKDFHIYKGLGDQHMGIPLEDALVKKGIKNIEAYHHTQAFNSGLYKNLKDMIWDKRIEFYQGTVEPGQKYCEVIKELSELQEQQVGRDLYKVKCPSGKNHYDDRSDAIARMVHLASQDLKAVPKRVQAVKSGEGTMSTLQERHRRNLLGGSHSSRQVRRKRRW